MTGALWAAAAGLGFGVFQTLNRRALARMDIVLSTFLQLCISAIVLGTVSVATEDVSLIASAPFGALAAFGLVGFIHFFVGWTLLNLSQKLIGAARTGPLIATTPLFGAVFAALTLEEVPGSITVGGMLVTISGVLVLSGERRGAGSVSEMPLPPDGEDERLQVAGETDRSPLAIQTRTGSRSGLLAGLGTALCWAVSPIFIRRGLEGLPSPLLGVTVSMVASALAYGVVVVVRRPRFGIREATRSSLGFKLAAGLLVGLSTWMRWIALDLAAVAVVLSVSSISVPTVLVLAPLVVGRHLEPVTARLWFGSGLVLAGSMVLILKGS